MLNAPGSWHNLRIMQRVYDKLQDETLAGYYLVADTVFPAGSNKLKGRILSPMKVGQQLSGSQAQLNARLALNCKLLSYCQTAKWGMYSLQGLLRCLHVLLEVGDIDSCADLLKICVCLHNLRACQVGYNQIQTVYMCKWCGDMDQIHLWQSFENILFSDQWKTDYISQYHIALMQV